MKVYILAQIVGTIGLILLLLSFQKNDKKLLLKFQMGSSFLFAIQYILLNAVTGFFMHIICLLRNVIYSKYNEKRIPLICLLVIVSLMMLFGIIFYNGFISIIPTIGCIAYSWAIWQKNLTVTRVVEAAASLLCIIYNVKVGAIAGVISTVIEMLLALIAIYRFDMIKIEKFLKKNLKINKQMKSEILNQSEE